MSFLGLLNPFCATLLLRGMKLVVAGSSAGTRHWEVPARQLCREHHGAALSIPERGWRTVPLTASIHLKTPNKVQQGRKKNYNKKPPQKTQAASGRDV